MTDETNENPKDKTSKAGKKGTKLRHILEKTLNAIRKRFSLPLR